MPKTGTLEWNWAWPPKGCKHEKCELGVRALRLMNASSDFAVSTEFHRVVQVGSLVIRHRPSLSRASTVIQIHYGQKQVLKFGGKGLMKSGTPGEIAIALEILRRHMLLEDLADV